MPVAYPYGTIPGFNPSHPVASKCQVSAAVVGGNSFVNLLTGQPATIPGGDTAPAGGKAIKSILGPCLGFDNSSGVQRQQFLSGLQAPASPYPTTMAGIFYLTALHNNVQCLIEDAASAQIQLGIFSNTFQLNRWGGSNDNTGFTPITGVPYFLACTTDNVSLTIIVWTRLDTGAVQWFTAVPGGTATAGTIAVSIGNATGAGNAFDGFIAAAMYAQAAYDLRTMLAWAADPWAFWYPNPNFSEVGSSTPGATPVTTFDTSLPIQPFRPDQTWAWSQTRMLGKDRLPNRQQDWPNPTQPPRLDQFTGWRQTGMFGRDRLPNRQQDWPLPTPPPLLDQFTGWRQIGMFGKDQLPNRQQDWPNPTQPPAPGPTWTWRQTGMLGQDQLPFRQQDWPNPTQPPRIDATWVQGFAVQLQPPAFSYFRQTDFSVPGQVPYFDRTWIDQGIMDVPAISPFTQTDWPNPSQPPSFDRTWAFNQTIRLAPVAAIPFTNHDWPNPTQPPRLDQTWAWRQTGMQGQDSLPNRQQDWPVPGQPPRLDQTWLQGFSLTLSTTVILYPHNQFDWPNPTIAPRLDQSWAWSQTRMFGQDRLPFRQQQWPLPALHHLPRIEQTIVSGFTLELEGSVINFVPHNQTDWQLPIGWQMVIQPDRGSASWPGINLLPPPFLTFTSEWIIRARRRGRR